MRNILFDRLALYVLVLLAFVFAGCASSPSSKFYELNPMGAQTAETQRDSRKGSVVVAVGPLRIPDYLDRPQIVTRSGKNELDISEFNRWAGSIENNIIRVLAEDISGQLPPDRFFVVRWTPLIETQLPAAYRIEMLVNRFEGSLGSAVTLNVQWGVFGKDKGMLFTKEARIVEQVNGNSYDALVEAMSKALDRLGRDIATAIMSL